MVNKDSINYYCPIPKGIEIDGWKENLIDKESPEFYEPLVPVGLLSDYPDIASNGIYYGERRSPYSPGELKGALLTSFVRKTVAERLVEASRLLPPRFVLMVLDAFRTTQVQTTLFENFKNELMKSPYRLCEEEAARKTEQYVSRPSIENSPHLTGGAVDVTIVEFKDDLAWEEYFNLTCLLKKQISGNKQREKTEKLIHIEAQRWRLLCEQAHMLDMGVAFDEIAFDEKGRDKTCLHYYEIKLQQEGFLSRPDHEAMKNRRLLYNVLSSAGFTFYPSEPWHVDLYNKFWAQQSGQKARYGFVELSNDNRRQEMLRRVFLTSLFYNDDGAETMSEGAIAHRIQPVDKKKMRSTKTN